MEKQKSKGKKIAVIVVCSFIGVVLLYALVCCGITFIPMLKMTSINKVACGNGDQPVETVELDGGAKLHVFPSGGKKDKYVIVCPGGGYLACSKETEGYNVATELNKMGYTAFVLEYRVGERITEPMAPLDDLAKAIYYVDENAQKYNVYKGLYALCGFSAGGNLIGLFGTEKFGYCNYRGIKAPTALIMGYPWCNPNTPAFNGNVADTVFYSWLNGHGSKAFLGDEESIDDMRVPLWITDEYPRTFIMHGDSDVIVPADAHSGVLAEKLEENEIEYVYKKYKGVVHGCGLGIGTSAEGWLKEAMAFADAKWYEEEYEPDPIDCEGLKAKAGGFMCGVCHPDWKYDELAELGGEWVRIDVRCLPLDENGNETELYKAYKMNSRSYSDRGIKVMAVSPFPTDFIENGLDPRKEEDMPKILAQYRYFIEDYQGIASAVQVMNELTEPQFRDPLTMEEAARFLIEVMKVVNRYKGDIIVGYNLSATDFSLFLDLMKGHNDYCDFIGIDVYLGCFESFTHNLGFVPATAWLQYVWSVAKRPVVLTEFGYLSAGERMSDEDKLSLLRGYGAQGDTVSEAEAYAKSHIREFIENERFPVRLRERLEMICKTDEQIADTLFGVPGLNISYAAHLYMELEENVNIKGYPHTPEGQADYFTDFFDKVIYNCGYLCGAFMYCFNDSAACYVCGQEHCPVETGWGLLDGDGNKKPAFYAVQEAFEKCKEVKNK